MALHNIRYMKQFALIVAGGSGSRMSADKPKQFMLLNNRPILMHTIQKFYDFNNAIEIVVVLPDSQFEYWRKLCAEFDFSINHQVIKGGDERFFSVKNGLDVLSNDGIVFIHDGVRPLVSHQTIQRALDTTLQHGNAVPVLPVIESLRKIDEGGNEMVDRSQFVGIQTPQTFLLSEIKEAYQQNFSKAFTDDTSVLECTGKIINLIEGNRENIKITNPIDLKIAEALLGE